MATRTIFSRGLSATLVLALAGVSPLAAQRSEQRPARAPFGIDMSAMDAQVDPGDDFFRYVNGHWYDTRTFAPDETYVGARADLIAQRKRRVRDIIDDVARNPDRSPTARLVGTFYASFMDERRIDAVGLAAAAADLQRIRSIQSYAALFEMFAQAPASGFPSPIEGSIFYDLHAPGWMRYTLTPGGLGLPNRDAYLGDAAATRRAAYRDYVRDLLTLAGETGVDTKVDAILALETRLAELQWPTADARDFIKTANSLPIADLQALTPDFDWRAFLAHAGVSNVDTVIVRQPSTMAPLIETIRETPLATWRAWAIAHYLSDNAPYLSSAVAQREFAFHGRLLSGQETDSPRWQKGVELVESVFGQAVGKLYVERWFPESSKQIIATMFANIRAEMRDRILNAGWMSDHTRAEAIRKIDTMAVKIGYPDTWPDYSGLHLDPEDFYGNLTAARAYSWRQKVAVLGARLPADKWMTTPQSSGAAANPVLNEITVPAGALEPPYFDPNVDPAVNYGAIGGVLGHELSHMFDQFGRQMDATGNLRDWWSPEDAKRYETIARKVEKQFSAFEILPGVHVDGKLTLNENIADISGLTLAWGAYHRSLGGAEAPVIAGYSGDQRLFMSWAQMRAGKMRAEMLRQVVASDPHAPDMLRVNGVVRNIDAWYDAFDVAPGDRLYLAPADRAHFW